MPQQFVPRNEATSPFYAGIDLGGTTIKAGIVDNQGRTLKVDDTVGWHTLPTEVGRGPEAGVQRIVETLQGALDKIGMKMDELAAVGVGSPGTLDFRKGEMITPTNFPGWGGYPLRDDVARLCGVPVSLANDASAAAYGEFWIGSGSGYHSLLMLTLGTGVGCGIIIGDLILEGENGHGTECGHIIVDPSPTARLCSCKQTGHLESYASANGVIGRTADALAAGRASSLSPRLAAGEAITPLLVAEEAERGDALSREIVIETADYLAIGIVTLMHTIDPTGVLLGGAMTFGMNQTELGRMFIERVREQVRAKTFPVLATRTRIEFASLGNEAGYLGAAGIARVDYSRNILRKKAVVKTGSTRKL
jgi:glucokinase